MRTPSSSRSAPVWMSAAYRLVQRARLARELGPLSPFLRRIAPLTMVPTGSLVTLSGHVRTIVREKVAGDFVECGVWRGGSSFLMAQLARQLGDERTVWLFDSFEGLPQPEPIDGPAAQGWAEATESATYFDNCRASLEDVRTSARELGLESCTRLVKGWFEATLPRARAELGPIALLRIDADWHSSVRCCLDNLYDLVSEGGIVILDDYFAWDGCAVAVHEFLGERRLAHRIRQGGGSGAWFRKT